MVLTFLENALNVGIFPPTLNPNLKHKAEFFENLFSLTKETS